MAAKRRHRSSNEYLKYLKGELSSEERYSFERDLEADPFDREAMEGMGRLSGHELEEDLLTLHARLQKRVNRRKRRNWYYAAATVASLLIVGTVFINIYEFDPKTASESIPADESFLHENAGMQKEEKSEYVLREEADEEETVIEHIELEPMAAEQAAAEPETGEPVEAERVEAPRKALDAVDLDLKIEAPFPAAGKAVEQVVADHEALEQVEAKPELADREGIAEREVVAVEAQPGRSEKKGRAVEPVREEPREAPMEAAVSYVPGRVSGIVVSAEDMKPLPGAFLVVKGSDSGVVAGMDGRFAFTSDQQQPATVIASYMGMETGEYQLAGGTENRLVMQPDPASMNEVVILGYDADRSIYSGRAAQQVKLDQNEMQYKGAWPEGGLEAFKRYIEEQIRFPAGDTLSKKEVVVLQFQVDRIGTISHIQTLRSPGDVFTEEALRLLQEGPAWNPARDESGVTDDVVRMRIVFKR